jgi:peptidyl-dipeptidase Dcp
VLKKYAKHYKTDEVIPDQLLAKLFAARNFNLGFDTIEYTACALLDQTIHQIPPEELVDLDIGVFEKNEMQRLGMPEGIILRHRPAHFGHLFSGSSYASAYYWRSVRSSDCSSSAEVCLLLWKLA